MYCLTHFCYVCLEMKNNLISSVDSSMSVNKELLDIFGFCAHNLAWLKTKRIIMICEECSSRLREIYQFLQMWHKNSALLQNYNDLLNGPTLSNTENEAELLVHLKDIHQVKCEIKDEQIHTDIYEPINEETQDMFVNIEDSLTIDEDLWKKEEKDVREECAMDNNPIEDFQDSAVKEEKDVFVNTEEDTAEYPMDNNSIEDCQEDNTWERYTIIEETQNVSVYTENLPIIEEDTCKTEETNDREQYPMDINSTNSMNNESDSEISVNTHITDTDYVSSEFKQAPATNKTDSNIPANKPHTRATCSKSFTREADLKIHTRFHTDEKPYQCARCDKYFSFRSKLVQHMRTHTGEKPYKCDICDKCFCQEANLMTHMRTHTGEKPYKCDRCDKCFCQKTTLMCHIRSHTGEKPYKCNGCGKKFVNNSSLARHMRTHTGEKPYKCGTCKKCFGSQTGLTYHMLIHTGKKPYKCDRCEKCFRLQSHLVKHMRTHTGE